MPPEPAGHPMLRIPAPGAKRVEIRYAPLARRDEFSPPRWPVQDLTRAGHAYHGWWEIDIDALGLDPGAYEYEFILDGHIDHPVADPFAGEITRFGGYRGVFHISAERQRAEPEFSVEGLLATCRLHGPLQVPGIPPARHAAHRPVSFLRPAR
jgi:hypothetical protein